MAQIKVPKQPQPVEINKFLGQNDTPDGLLGLQLGEATNMLNFRITPNFKLKKREGYKSVISGLIGNVQGMWYGKLNGTYYFLFANNGHLYKLVDGVSTDLGTLTDAPTWFIPFSTKVYILNGYEYKSFDGTTFQTVTGYIPKIAIGAPPSGGGTPYENINLLIGKKHMTFNANGTDKTYTLPESALNSIDSVYVNGALKVVTTDYTVDLTNGKVTFVTAPTTGQDNVDIWWTKGTGNRALIENCRFAMDYSGQTDARVFLWGGTVKNRRFWSGLANGVPSAEYFEANAYDDLGNGQFGITDIVKQYDRQKIFFENGGGAMYSYYEATMDSASGQLIVNFPVYELNDEVGQVAAGQTQIANNCPLTLQNGVHAWEASIVRDQTNQRLISQRVQNSLTSVDLSTAKTVNWKENQEYWINVGSIVWVYNYLNDTWYKFDNIQATCFVVVNGELYFGANGSINKFEKGQKTDNGTPINAIWEMGFYDFGAEWLNKYMNNIWVSLFPELRSSVDVQVITNSDGLSEKQTIYYNHATYDHVNYAHWSYNTSYNPQPFYIDIQAMGFSYFKVTLTNNSELYDAIILSINMPAKYGGRVR